MPGIGSDGRVHDSTPDGSSSQSRTFNRAWEDAIWNRWYFESWEDLRAQTAAFIGSYRDEKAAPITQIPSRIEIPSGWRPTFPEKVTGKVVFLRFTNDLGEAFLLGQNFLVDANFPNRRMRCEVDFTNDLISFYLLRRSEPTIQPLIATLKYKFPEHKFGGKFEY